MFVGAIAALAGGYGGASPTASNTSAGTGQRAKPWQLVGTSGIVDDMLFPVRTDGEQLVTRFRLAGAPLQRVSATVEVPTVIGGHRTATVLGCA